MFKRVRTLFCCTFILSVLLAGSVWAAGTDIKTLNKESLLSLVRANSGKAVMLNFFATWCPPCRAEIPTLVAMQKQYGDRVKFIGLTVDDMSTMHKVRPFTKRLGVNYEIYRADDELVRMFAINSIPYNVFYDKNGKKVLAGSGVVDHESFEQIIEEILK